MGRPAALLPLPPDGARPQTGSPPCAPEWRPGPSAGGLVDRLVHIDVPSACRRQSRGADSRTLGCRRQGASFEVGAHAEIGKNRRLLGDVSEAQTSTAVLRQSVEDMVIQLDRSGSCSQTSRDDIEQRALARTIRAEKRHPFTSPEPDRDITQHRLGAPARRKLTHHQPPPSPRHVRPNRGQVRGHCEHRLRPQARYGMEQPMG